MPKTGSVLLIVSSSLREPNGLRALDLADQFNFQGKKTGIYLLQNAVLGGVEKETKIRIQSQINSGIDFYCLEEDLTMRGFAKKNLPPQFHISDYSGLIDLMMEKYGKVFGAF
ncbi:MAG: DsrH/TusB family sulfur metabolism protein [Candidatus Aminicenantales bacterium]